MGRSEETSQKSEKNFEKIEKNENFHFWKFPRTSTSKCCRKVNECSFWESTMPGFLRSPHIYLTFFHKNFSQYLKFIRNFLNFFQNFPKRYLNISRIFLIFRKFYKFTLRFFSIFVKNLDFLRISPWFYKFQDGFLKLP